LDEVVSFKVPGLTSCNWVVQMFARLVNILNICLS